MGKRRVARVCGRIGQDLSMSIETCQDFSHTSVACSGFWVFGSGGFRGGARRAARKNLVLQFLQSILIF